MSRRLTPDARRVPAESSRISRKNAWKLVVANDRLVHSTIRRFLAGLANDGYVYGITEEGWHDELIGAAYEAALRAVEGFDPTRGTQLSTYVVVAIQHAIVDEMNAVIRQRGPEVNGELTLPAPLEAVEEDEAFSYDGLADRVAERVDTSATLAEATSGWTDQEFMAAWLWASGYKHGEVAEMMGLSRSQLSRLSTQWRAKGRDALDS